MLHYCCRFIFFFDQKTAYELRISDWSSDVCSSDLVDRRIDVAMFRVMPQSQRLATGFVDLHIDPVVTLGEAAARPADAGTAASRPRRTVSPHPWPRPGNPSVAEPGNRRAPVPRPGHPGRPDELPAPARSARAQRAPS